MNYEKNFTPYLTLPYLTLPYLTLPYLSRIMLKPQVLRLYLSLFLLFGFVGFGQENDKKLDSLTTKFKTLEGKEKLHFAVLTYLPYLQYKNPKRSIKIVDSLLPYTKNKLKNYRVALYNQKGTSYELLLKDSLALNCYDETIKTAHNIADSIGVVRGLQSKAIFYGKRQQFDSCLIYLTKGVKKIDNNIYNPAVDSLQNKALSIRLKSNLATLYTIQEKWDKAIEYNYKVLELAKNLKKKDIQLLSYGYLASIFQSTKNYDKAYEYAKKEMILAEKENEPIPKAYSYLHFAEALMLRDSAYAKAEEYCVKAQKLFKKNNEKRGENNSINHLFTISRLQKKYHKALKLESDLVSLTKLVKGDLAKVYTEIGYVYGKIKNYPKADYYFNLGKKEYGNRLKKGVFYFGKRAEIYAEKKEYKKAYKYSVVIDSIEKIKLNDDFKNRFTKLETKYQTQQKENEILRLSNENNKQKTAMAQTRLLIAIILAVISVFALIAYFRWRKRKQEQQLEILEKSIEASDNEKNRIGRELHDGIASKIIQLANNAENLNTEYTQQLHGIYNEIRDLSHQLNKTPTHSNEPIFERILELKSSVKNQTVNLKIQPVSLVVREPMATHIYRIVQELFTNNIKHANSTEISLNISTENEQLIFLYHDNGKGINTDILEKGDGFKNIEHRVSLMKGTILYNSPQADGFSLTIKMPLL